MAKTRTKKASSPRSSERSDAATQYARDVVDGRIVAGPLVRLACKRHLKDLEDGPRRGLRWDLDAASRVYRFFETILTLAEGEHVGQPFLLQPWQKFVLGSLFGWKGSDGHRRFRTAYVEIGKGNGKSPMAAGIGLYGLVADAEAGAEIYSAATTVEQAKILFRDAVNMVDAAPELAALIHKHGGVEPYNLSVARTASYFRPVSAEHRGLDGKRVHIALIDEIHEHPNALVVDKIRAGTKGRRQALIFEITNSGYDRQSVCWHHHEYSRQILECTVENDSWFAYVCGLDDGDDFLNDPSCWVKANPNLGVSITHKYLREQVDEAKGMPSKASLVLRLNGCIWTQQQTRFYDMEAWRACSANVADSELVGVPCYGGLDLGKSDDFSAFVLLWVLPDGRHVVRVWFWIPDSALQRFPTRPYEMWKRAGVINVTPGAVTDLDFVEKAISELCQQHSPRMVGYDDRYAEQMRLHLEGDGINMVKVRQGFGLNEALTRMNELVMQRVLCHGGHPILTWMADNLMVRQGTMGEIRPDKERAAEKIDGQVALAMALQCAIGDSADTESVWDKMARGEIPEMPVYVG
jgi:phage terminase large subunit-like protein